MEKDTAQGGIPAIIIAIILLIIGWFFLFPAVCKSIPLRPPGWDFDFCFFFK
jgi:hypothetical protein